MCNIDLKSLTRNDLLSLVEEAKEELKRFRPYRIKERLTTCGNKECWCNDGDDLHGPYLYATYREDGKTKSISLGPKLEVWEIEEAIPGYPDLTEYLVRPNHIYEKMPVEDVQGWFCMTLNDIQFKARYGVSKGEDNFDRAVKFWGTSEDYDRYLIQLDLYREYREVPYNPWVGWGIGNLRAIAVLTSLEERGYYQK